MQKEKQDKIITPDDKKAKSVRAPFDIYVIWSYSFFDMCSLGEAALTGRKEHYICIVKYLVDLPRAFAEC